MTYRFQAGHVVATPGALRAFEGGPTLPSDLIERHRSGDWGECCAEDAAENERALDMGTRLMSVYQVHGRTLWVITEADRSVTTILLPTEY